ncbi:putative amidohydrolase [Paraburkholderia sp. MM5496-R1]|uniref:carbon-nitrogen hydrolase family protein n=1 Tax=Paraburkholderia sp. MM5496-R1 TaxID=2991065 RepID=UPI003D23737F
MTSSLSIACVQVSPNGDRHSNIEEAVAGVRRAAANGATLITLPEYAAQLHSRGRVMRDGAGSDENDEALAAFSAVARECQCWVLVGSLTMRASNDKIYNRSYLFADDGSVAASYEKLHMFNATLPTGRVINEGALYEAGSRAVAAETPWGLLGLTICYDLRFPHLYRALAQAGAKIIAVPSAFTRATGQMHWHALLRARAIENACYIIAPATCGTHPEDHSTFGHSLVVDPFGTIVLEAGDEPGVFQAEIDLSQVDVARALIPSLTHDRPFQVDVVSRNLGKGVVVSGFNDSRRT